METAPAEKTKKYDRQIRLWGEHGQECLESAKVCLINANATGTEILKNLILPGIGSFTIVDNNKITGQDVGNNFFLDKDSIGKSRAQVSTDFLLEMNEDASGDYLDESVENLLDNNSVFFSAFHLVIACDVHEKALLRLGELLYDHDVPLLVCRSYGFIGYMRVVLKEHTIMESQPDNALDDLRLDRPFPRLVQFCDGLDLDAMSQKDHSHTPWLVLLYKFLIQWKVEHDGLGPQNYKQKNELKECIRTGIRTNEEGVPLDEENFDEAIKHVNTALNPTSIPSEIQQIFNDPCCMQLHSESKPFWILARAVYEFVQNEGCGALPLRGSIPDMTADSERYIQLQNIYKQQASDDVSIVANYVQHLLETLGRPHENITDSDIRKFCKNAAFLRVLRMRSLADEYSPAPGSSVATGTLSMHLDDADHDAVFYVMLRAVDRFYEEFNHYPGYFEASIETDIAKLKGCLAKLLHEWGISQNVKDDYVHEMCRYGASELHSVAAYMGGVAAQEVIKILTGQFVPVNNTFIYNAMKQTSCTLVL